MLKLANDRDGVLVVFCGVGVFICFQGVYWRCGWGRRLVLHWAESCKGLMVQLPHKLVMCSNL